ncbi:hypothetical protein EDD85DRAFT_327809 [Armillaria nabsnona]|nr:hypothetical protein EDD85DRAFT_327809 [Armillaria nabsnona]
MSYPLALPQEPRRSFCCPELEGKWHGLASSVNHLAGVTTGQARSTTSVTKAVALGDSNFREKLRPRCGGVLGLKFTVKGVIATLRTFAAEVTRLTTEVDIPATWR